MVSFWRGKGIVASKYTRGRKIRSVGDFEKAEERMFWVWYGKPVVRHRGWLVAQQFNQLRILIDKGMYVATPKDEVKNDGI